mgnify:CR=1 FL=1
MPSVMGGFLLSALMRQAVRRGFCWGWASLFDSCLMSRGNPPCLLTGVINWVRFSYPLIQKNNNNNRECGYDNGFKEGV